MFANSFLNADEEWLSIADEEVDPIFELANKYKLAIQIHPYDGEKMIALKKINIGDFIWFG